MKMFKSMRSLTYMNLATAGFYGRIPQVFCSNKFTFMVFTSNQLTGPVPNCFGSVFQISVEDNHMTGTLPSQLFQLKSLSWFALDNNYFKGMIPSSSTHAITYLYLPKNQLTGHLPCFKKGETMVSYSVSFNHLTGTVPTCLRVIDFECANNQLTGKIPFNSFKTTLITSFNTFTGVLPERSSMLNMQLFEIDKNSMEGILYISLISLSLLCYCSCHIYYTANTPTVFLIICL